MKKTIPILVIIVGLSIVLYLGFIQEGTQQKELVITGRVEADEIVLSAEIPGRLKSIQIQEGMPVKKGQVVAIVDDSELLIQKEEIIRRTEAERLRLKARETELKLLTSTVDAEIAEAEQMVRMATARRQEAEAVRQRLQSQYYRMKRLFNKGVVPKDRVEEVEKAYRVSLSRVAVAEASLKKAEASLQKARDAKLKKKILLEEIRAGRRMLEQLYERLKRIQLKLDKTRIKAPASGIIYRKTAETGEFVAPGMPVAVMLLPESIYVKTFLPETFLARVKLKTPVKIFTDAYSDRAVQGYVCYISDRAEFTPKEIDSSEERVKQVFEMKICFDRPSSLLKKGMPVDVVIPLP